MQDLSPCGYAGGDDTNCERRVKIVIKQQQHSLRFSFSFSGTPFHDPPGVEVEYDTERESQIPIFG
jgi:hypothetical protein